MLQATDSCHPVPFGYTDPSEGGPMCALRLWTLRKLYNETLKRFQHSRPSPALFSELRHLN